MTDIAAAASITSPHGGDEVRSSSPSASRLTSERQQPAHIRQLEQSGHIIGPDDSHQLVDRYTRWKNPPGLLFGRYLLLIFR